MALCCLTAPREEEFGALLAAMEDRRMVMLYGPRQSGKTTLLQFVQARMENVLRVTFQDIRDQLHAGKAWSAVNALLATAAGMCDEDVDDDGIGNVTWLRKMVTKRRMHSAPVIIIDDFDVLLGCPEQVKDDIASGLRALVTPSRPRRVVGGIILCGHGGGPADIKFPCSKVSMSTFTVSEARAMFNDYVSDAVVEDIVTDTGGHKGWTVFAAGRLHSNFSSGALLTSEHWKEEKRAFEQALVSSTALGDAVRYAGDGAVRERVQRILHAVAAGSRTAIAKYDSGGREDDLTDVCRCLVSWGVLAVDEEDGGGGPVQLGAPLAVRLVRTAVLRLI